MLEEMVTVRKNSPIIKIKKPKGKTSFRRIRYPYGRRVNLRPRMRKNNLAVVKFDILREINSSGPGNIRVLFNDPVNGVQMVPTEFEIKGESVNIPIKPEGLYKKIKIKIYKF